MHLQQVPLRLRRLSELRGLKYSLAVAASIEEIRRAEERLGLSFPEQLKLFYGSYNGLRVDDPQRGRSRAVPRARRGWRSPPAAALRASRAAL